MLNFELLIYNMFILFSSFSPCFAFLVSKMKFMDGKVKYYFSFIIFMLITILFLFLFYPPDVKIPNSVLRFTPISSLVMYPLFIVLSSFVLKFKFKVEYSKIIALSLLLGFLSTELHELPAFIQEYVNIGIINYHAYPNHFLTHFATVGFYFLTVKIADVKISLLKVYAFFLVFFLTYLCYLFDPFLDFVPFTFYNYLKRFLWFGWLAYVFYDGGV